MIPARASLGRDDGDIRFTYKTANSTHAFAFPRRDAPETCMKLSPIEGVGNAGRPCTRSLASPTPTPIPTIGVHPGQADAAERTRKPDEGGLREADSGCQSVGNDTAVNAVHSVIARSDLSAVAQ